jgi:hypothetical protein
VNNLRQLLTTLSALLLIILASCTPAETKRVLEPSQALGVVIAEETVRVCGPSKRIVLIVPQWATASTAGESLKTALKKQAVTIVSTLVADVGNPMRTGRLGLKFDDFSAAVAKATGVGAVVSLAGAPFLKPGDDARFSPQHVAVVVVATASLGNVMGVPGDPMQLAGLIENGIIQLAIVDRTDQDAKASDKMDSIHQTFAQNYRMLRRPD